MKGRYVTTQLMLTCLSRQHIVKKDIHTALRETIDERKEIIGKIQDTLRKAEIIKMYVNHSYAA